MDGSVIGGRRRVPMEATSGCSFGGGCGTFEEDGGRTVSGGRWEPELSPVVVPLFFESCVPL